MPRHIRPFYIDVEIDGRESNLRGGPLESKGGEMTVDLTARSEDGKRILTPVKIWCEKEREKSVVTVMMNNKSFRWVEKARAWPACFHNHYDSPAEIEEALYRVLLDIARYANEIGLDAPGLIEKALIKHMEGDDG